MRVRRSFVAWRARLTYLMVVPVFQVAIISAVHAAGEEPVSAALAQSLFDEGRALLDAQQVPAACLKFAESQRLDPSGGTLLNLAVCHEQEGKTASAWLEFGESWSIALREGREDRVTIAKAHLSRLEPLLSKVLIRYQGRSRPELTLDGREIPSQALGLAIPIDPGEHELAAQASGRIPFKQQIHILADASLTEVTIPELGIEKLNPAQAAPARLPSRSAPSAGAAAPSVQRPPLRRTGSYVLAATSLSAAVAGAVLGVQALRFKSRSDDACPDGHCTAQGAEWSRRAASRALLSDVCFAVAAVAAGGSLYFWFSAQPEDTHGFVEWRARF